MNTPTSMKKAVVINAVGKYSKVILALIVNAILARILSPDDYGIVAVITVFSTMFSTVADMGFGPAIIQNRELERDDIDNIYSFTAYISSALMIAFVACSYLIALFYHNMVYFPLGCILSVSLFFNALNMVPNGILNRDKQFLIIAKRTIVVYVASSIITVILALLGMKYYAIVIETVLSAIFTFLWNYFTTRPRFIYKVKLASVRKVLNYSGYQFAFNCVNYLSRNLDNLLTGKFMGNAELGYYNKAYTLMLYPVNNLTGVISPVLHPIFSDYQNQKDMMYKKYIIIFKILSCIAIYFSPVCFLGSSEIITIMYGKNWSSSVRCFQFLSIAIMPQILNSSAGGVFQALGSTKLLFHNSLINTTITVGAIMFGIIYGKNIQFLSMCVAIAYICNFFTAFYMLIRLGFHYPIKKFVKEILPEIFLITMMIFGTALYRFSVANIFLSLVVKSLWLLVFMIAGMLITQEYKVFKELLNRKNKT